jgi:CRP/FNR family transcriptional regulator, nitrogen fixation regulation protein
MATHARRGRADYSSHYRRLMADRPHLLQSLDSLAVILPFRRGQEVCRQGQSADYWFYVVSGAARRCAIRPDGRRQIVDLLLPGNFFGFTVFDHHDYTVEAVAKDTVLAAYPRRRVEMVTDSDPTLARELRQVIIEALARLQAQLLIIGRITAPEKVGSFILELAERLSPAGADRVALPISRYDIAECLAVSVETVSRSLTDLRQRGLIEMSGTRTVRIVNRDALEECSPSKTVPRVPVRFLPASSDARRRLVQ